MATLPTEVPTPNTSPTSSELLYMVSDPYGTPANDAATNGNTITKAHGLSDGIVKVASGTMTPATAGTDYYNPSGTDVAVADGGTGASTASNARSNLSAAALGANTDITSVNLSQTGLTVKGGDANSLTIKPNETLTGAKTLNVIVNDTSRTVNLGGNITTAGALTTSGANALTLTTTGSTGVTLPTTGTLATLAGTEVLTNKTLSGNTATNLISGSGTLTLNTSNTAVVPSANDTLVGKATTDTLTNKTYDTAGSGNVFKINGTTISDITGTGKNVLDTSPTLVTPALGTPSALVGTNITGTASGLTAGNVTTNANLTGVITSSGNATSIASQTGTGTKFVVDTSPTIVTPTIASFTNATHNHSNAAGGGTLVTSAFTSGTIPRVRFLAAAGATAWNNNPGSADVSVATTVLASAFSFAANDLAIGDMVEVDYVWQFINNSGAGRVQAIAWTVNATTSTYSSASITNNASARCCHLNQKMLITTNTQAKVVSTLSISGAAGTVADFETGTSVNTYTLANITSSTNALDLKLNSATNNTTQSYTPFWNSVFKTPTN